LLNPAPDHPGRVGLKRPSVYKIPSKNGNPALETLQEILEPLGLRMRRDSG